MEGNHFHLFLNVLVCFPSPQTIEGNTQMPPFLSKSHNDHKNIIPDAFFVCYVLFWNSIEMDLEDCFEI